jgi:hypothetical protein
MEYYKKENMKGYVYKQASKRNCDKQTKTYANNYHPLFFDTR